MEPLTRFQEDVLADVLQSLRLQSSLYCRAREELVPNQPLEKEGVYYSGGQGAATTLVCGSLHLEDHPTNPLLPILPPLLHLRLQDGQSSSWLGTIVQLVKAEASANQPAAETVITRLSEILFIQAVRTHLSTVDSGTRGWFNALKDPQVGQALVLVQYQPAEPWSVESLAGGVGLSRSAFSAKFRQLVGEPPMRYVTRLRLAKAAALLRTHPSTLIEVARSIGYESEVAFSKTFRRCFGIAPGAYRQGRRLPAVN